MAGGPTALGDQGQDDVRIQPGRVRGGEILGDEDAGGVRHLDARFGFADDVGHDPAFDVAQVGGPFGHQAAHLGEDPDELVDGRGHRGDKVLAGVELLADGAAQSLVAGEAGAGREHLGRGTGRLVGLAAEAVRDRAGRVVVRRQGGLGVCELSGAEALDGLGRDLSADQQGGPEGDAGDDGSALQNGGRRGFSGGGHDH